jgi:hypothetical protein
MDESISEGFPGRIRNGFASSMPYRVSFPFTVTYWQYSLQPAGPEF